MESFRRQIHVNAKGLNLKATIESGQPLTFTADYLQKNNHELLNYPTQKGLLLVDRNMNNGSLSFDYFGDYTSASAYREIQRRFGLDAPMKKIYQKINTDPFMENAIRTYDGMRVTSNNSWEATLCFLVSQFNNLKRIRGIMRSMTERFGETLYVDGKRLKLFPTPESMAKASIAELNACGTGFRAKYIKSVSTEISKGFDLNSVGRLKTEEAKRELLRLDGVGDKVADCVLLYGYNRLDTFPIDIWVKRVVEKVYMNGRKKNIRHIHDFASDRWGSYAGYAEHYLFWHGRSLAIR